MCTYRMRAATGGLLPVVMAAVGIKIGSGRYRDARG